MITLYENENIKIEYSNLDGFIYIEDKENLKKRCFKHIKDISYEIMTEWERNCRFDS